MIPSSEVTPSCFVNVAPASDLTCLPCPTARYQTSKPIRSSRLGLPDPIVEFTSFYGKISHMINGETGQASSACNRPTVPIPIRA